MSDKPAPIPIAAAWWSNKQRTAQLTVTTQMSLNRVKQLVAMCHSWPGPISAALLVPLHPKRHAPPPNTTALPAGNLSSSSSNSTLLPPALQVRLDTALETLSRIHAALESKAPCQLDLLVAYERYDNGHSAMLYPVNVMRNYAKLQARTRMVGQFDADMLVSRTLFESLQDPATAAALEARTAARTAVVVPGFITHHAPHMTARQIADQLALNASSKAQLVPYFHARIIQRFDPKGAGHRATRSKSWLSAADYYNVTYEHRYEPWVVVDRAAAPFFDARFRGYGQNKIIHLEHLNWTGYTFAVHPTAFLIHRFHKTTNAKLRHAQDFTARKGRPGWNLTVYGHAAMLGQGVRELLRNGTYRPVLDPATEACRRTLPWWQGAAVQWQQQQQQADPG